MSTEEEVQALKDATRAAHEALADLKAEHKAMKDTLTAMRAQVIIWQEEANEQFGEIVRAGLEEFSKSLKVAIDDGTQRVFKRFDTLADIMLGEEKGNNNEPMALLVKRWKATKP